MFDDIRIADFASTRVIDHSLHTDSGLLRLRDRDRSRMSDVVGQQGVVTPPRHLIPPGVFRCPSLP